MKTGDRVKIMKPNHPALNRYGIIMRVEWLETEDDGLKEVALVAGCDPIEYACKVVKVFPIYVIRLMWLDIDTCGPEPDEETAYRIAVAVYEDRGLEEFPELVEYPNRMKHITG